MLQVTLPVALTQPYHVPPPRRWIFTVLADAGKVPQVMYVLKGSLTGYTAATGSADGSVGLTVKSANYHGATLKNQMLTFALPSTAKVVLHDGAAINPTTDHGMVKVRGPKKIAATDNLASVLQALKAFRVIDQGPAS